MMDSSYRIGSMHQWSLRRRQSPFGTAAVTLYQVTDRLHAGRTVRVPANGIVTTVSAWLAELGARSPLVEDLGRAVRAGDWPTACAIGEHLSVDVTLAA